MMLIDFWLTTVQLLLILMTSSVVVLGKWDSCPTKEDELCDCWCVQVVNYTGGIIWIHPETYEPDGWMCMDEGKACRYSEEPYSIGWVRTDPVYLYLRGNWLPDKTWTIRFDGKAGESDVRAVVNQSSAVHLKGTIGYFHAVVYPKPDLESSRVSDIVDQSNADDGGMQQKIKEVPTQQVVENGVMLSTDDDAA